MAKMKRRAIPHQKIVEGFPLAKVGDGVRLTKPVTAQWRFKHYSGLRWIRDGFYPTSKEVPADTYGIVESDYIYEFLNYLLVLVTIEGEERHILVHKNSVRLSQD